MDKEVGIKILVFPFSLAVVYGWFFIEDSIVKLMMLPFAALFSYMIYSLIYVLFVEKELKFSIDYNSFIWLEYENGILVKKARVYKKDIKAIGFNSFYKNGMYTHLSIDIVLKNDKKINLSDGSKHSLEKYHTNIFAQLIVFNFENKFLDDLIPLKIKSYEKEKKNSKIFFIGLLRNVKRVVKLSLIITLIITVNIIINFLSYKSKAFDTNNNEVFDTYKAIKLNLNSKREKVFFFEGYYYSLINFNGKYIVLKQKEFSLEKEILCQWENSDYPIIFDELRDLPNGLELAKSLNNVTFRQLETWELIFKSLWLINYNPPYFFKNSSYVRSLEKYIKQKEKKKKLKEMEVKMKKKNPLIIKDLNKEEISFIQKQIVKIYVLLEIRPIKRIISDEFKQIKIDEKYELYYENKWDKSSKSWQSYLYLIKNDGDYINIFPKWADEKLKKLAEEKMINDKIYFEKLKQKFVEQINKQ